MAADGLTHEIRVQVLTTLNDALRPNVDFRADLQATRADVILHPGLRTRLVAIGFVAEDIRIFERDAREIVNHADGHDGAGGGGGLWPDVPHVPASGWATG
jgi:hypothetical protein